MAYLGRTLQFFRSLLSRDKPETRSGPWNSGENIKIRRKYIYEDAFRNLNEKNGEDCGGDDDGGGGDGDVGGVVMVMVDGFSDHTECLSTDVKLI